MIANYGLQKIAAQRKQAFANKLAAYMQANRGVDYVKTASEARADVRKMIKKAALKQATR